MLVRRTDGSKRCRRGRETSVDRRGVTDVDRRGVTDVDRRGVTKPTASEDVSVLACGLFRFLPYDR